MQEYVQATWEIIQPFPLPACMCQHCIAYLSMELNPSQPRGCLLAYRQREEDGQYIQQRAQLIQYTVGKGDLKCDAAHTIITDISRPYLINIFRQVIHLFQDSYPGCIFSHYLTTLLVWSWCYTKINHSIDNTAIIPELLQAMTVAFSDTTLIKWLLESAQDNENDSLLWDASKVRYLGTGPLAQRFAFAPEPLEGGRQSEWGPFSAAADLSGRQSGRMTPGQDGHPHPHPHPLPARSYLAQVCIYSILEFRGWDVAQHHLNSSVCCHLNPLTTSKPRRDVVGYIGTSSAAQVFIITNGPPLINPSRNLSICQLVRPP